MTLQKSADTIPSRFAKLHTVPVTRGILLANLGTPQTSKTTDVRRYLGEFLMDRHVLDVPWALRRLIVSAFILPWRPRRSAAAYAKIWDAAGPGTGSPLLHYSEGCRQALAGQTNEPVALAMRYGEPGIEAAMENLIAQGVDDIVLIPMYPQHADSTRTTCIEAARAALPPNTQLRVIDPFYADSAYIAAQATLIREHLPAQWDYLLLSYHGLPERHLQKADPTGAHCLADAACCDTPSPAHATCYRHQAYVTSRLLGNELEVPADRLGVSFQSRLGRLPWLTPYTDQELTELPDRGVKHLVVACPAFVADNLETLEEIGIAGRQTFLDAGGETFTLVPCLNAQPQWIEVLAQLAREA